VLTISRVEATDYPVLYFFANLKDSSDVYLKFLARLLHCLFSHKGIAVPGAVETFVNDFYRAKTLNPDTTRMENLLIKFCHEQPTAVYVVLGNLENVPEDDREKVFSTIAKLWDHKRCKLLVSMSDQFFARNFLPKFPDSAGAAIPISPNMEDVRLFAKATIVKHGFGFLKSDENMATILKKVTDK